MSPETEQLPTLHLDPSLQLWVLLPLSLSTLLIGLLRRNLTILSTREPPTDLLKTRDANRLSRSKTLRRNAQYIAKEQFDVRRTYISEVLQVPKKELSAMTALMNPESLANQVTSLLLTLVPHFVLGTWARYMFAGMAVCRLPFTLTPRFRGMLQSGLEMAGRNLDVRYVSALSWYLLNTFGNAGLLGLLVGGKDDMVFMPSMASQIAVNLTPDKVFAQEKEALFKIQHRGVMKDVEDKLMEVPPEQFAEF